MEYRNWAHVLWFHSEYFQNKATLSYKALDRSVFFSDFDKYASIDAARSAMAKPYEVNWPCSREDEVGYIYSISRFLILNCP